MTKFEKAGFNYDGMYLTYGAERTFIARFKRGGMGDFKRFLIKNFTVQEYLGLKNAYDMAPLTILETKGYVHPNVRKAMKLGLI